MYWSKQIAAVNVGVLAGTAPIVGFMTFFGFIVVMFMCSYVTYAWLWARMMVTAAQRDDDFGRAKVTVGRFYYERLLPRAGALAEQIKAGAGTMMSLDQDLF